MTRTVRTSLVAVVAIVALLAIAPFLVPVDQFRPFLEGRASAAIGRKVEIGSLSLSLMRGSLSADKLTVADDPKFSAAPFLTARSVRISVRLLKLIASRSLDVTGITIENPELTLIRNSAGQWNYSSLGSSSGGASSASPEVSIRRVALRNGRMIVGSTASQARSTYDRVNVTASDVAFDSRWPVSATAQLPGGGSFKLDGDLGPIDRSDASLTPLDARIAIDRLDLGATGFLDPSAGLGGLLGVDGKIASSHGEAALDGTARLSRALLVAGGAPSAEPVTLAFHAKYNLRRRTGVLDPSTVTIGRATARLNGTYQSTDTHTIVNAKVDGENMAARDLESFLPAVGIRMPAGAKLAGGTFNEHLNITGPTDSLVTTGTVGLFNARLAAFDLGSKLGAISALAGVKTGKDLAIQSFTTNLRVAPDGLRLDRIDAVVPALGHLIGAGTIDAKNNLDFAMVATLARGLAAGAPVGGLEGLGGVLDVLTGGSSGGSQRLPFLVRGTTTDPRFLPDVNGLAVNMLKAQLGNLAKPDASQRQEPGNANPNADPLRALGGLFRKNR